MYLARFVLQQKDNTRVVYSCCYFILNTTQKCQLGPDIFYMQPVKTHINPLPCTKSSVNIKLPQRLDLAFSP